MMFRWLSFTRLLVTVVIILLIITALMYLYHAGAIHKNSDDPTDSLANRMPLNTGANMADQKIDYKGREIVIPQKQLEQSKDSSNGTLSKDDTKNTIELFINGTKLIGGLTAGGKYYLDKYAYDPQESIEDLAKKYVDHLDARIESKELNRKEESR